MSRVRAQDRFWVASPIEPIIVVEFAWNGVNARAGHSVRTGPFAAMPHQIACPDLGRLR